MNLLKTKSNDNTEEATESVSYKMVFLKLLQISLKNTCVRVFFLIKLQVFNPATLLRRDSNTVSSCYIYKMFNKNTYFKELLLKTASDNTKTLS